MLKIILTFLVLIFILGDLYFMLKSATENNAALTVIYALGVNVLFMSLFYMYR